MTISETIEKFRLHQQAQNRSPNTIDSYQRELGRLSRFIGDEIDPANIASGELDQFINSDLTQLRSDGKKRTPGSIANTKAILNSFFRWLQHAGHITMNPSISTRISKHNKIPVYLSDEETKSLLKAIYETRGWQAERDYTAVSIILYTGIRLSELINIDVDDVDFNCRKLRLRRTKGGQPAFKHINAKLMKILESYIPKKLETECPALLLSQWSRRLSDRQFALRLEMWTSKAGIAKKVTPHVLRHTFATSLYAKTKNLLAVQKALGHEYITTTQIYTHIQDEELQEALETL